MKFNQIKKTTTGENCSSLEILLASIYYLMTRHARLPDQFVANAISDHLEKLSNHPDCTSEVLRDAGQRLARQWRDHVLSNQGPAIPVRREKAIH